MNIVIVGYGLQGKSSAKYWHSLGHDVTIADQDSELSVPSDYKTKLGSDYLNNLHFFDVIVRAPSLHPNKIIAANTEHIDILEKVTTNTNEFFAACPSKNLIGVTGTKGKGTTSTLIAHMLQESGEVVHLIGNIGTPPLDALPKIKETDHVVLELANFQLIDMKHSPHIAICVMVEPEHLDWHEDFEEYITAKQQLFIHQNSDDVAIYFASNEYSEEIANASIGKIIPYFDKPGAYINKKNQIVINGIVIAHTEDIRLLGRHNQENICAAITATWQVKPDAVAIKKAITGIKSLPYRLEKRAVKNNITYYNDSFSAAPGACAAAITTLEQPKIMIIGGHDRQLDLTMLCDTIAKNNHSIRKVLLIGAAKVRVAEKLDSISYGNYEKLDAKDMSAIVRHAALLAESGDAVILSPGFPSFDMFKNFEERGQAFNRAVGAL